jgi:hypothetical protein
MSMSRAGGRQIVDALIRIGSGYGYTPLMSFEDLTLYISLLHLPYLANSRSKVLILSIQAGTAPYILAIVERGRYEDARRLECTDMAIRRFLKICVCLLANDSLGHPLIAGVDLL